MVEITGTAGLTGLPFLKHGMAKKQCQNDVEAHPLQSLTQEDQPASFSELIPLIKERVSQQDSRFVFNKF